MSAPARAGSERCDLPEAMTGLPSRLVVCRWGAMSGEASAVRYLAGLSSMYETKKQSSRHCFILGRALNKKLLLIPPSRSVLYIPPAPGAAEPHCVSSQKVPYLRAQLLCLPQPPTVALLCTGKICSATPMPIVAFVEGKLFLTSS